MGLFSQPLSLKPGKVIRAGREYIVERELGSGGSGVVYLAKDIQSNSQVAIKFFLPIYYLKSEGIQTAQELRQAHEQVQEFFRREVECLRQMRHPGIVPVIDTGVYKPLKSELVTELAGIGRVGFFVMPFIDGPNIKDFLEAESLPRV